MDLTVVDQCLNGDWGLNVITALRTLSPNSIFVLTSATLTDDDVANAASQGVIASSKFVSWRGFIESLESEDTSVAEIVTDEKKLTLETMTAEQLQVQQISRVMHRTNHNLTHAADKLGYSRLGLKKKLAKLGFRIRSNGKGSETAAQFASKASNSTARANASERRR